MKLLIALTLVYFVHGSTREPIPDENGLNSYYTFLQWKDYKEEHGKSYSDSDEEFSRYKTFKENLRRIEEHNREFQAGRRSFSLKMNHLGDMTTEEVKRVMNGFRPELGDPILQKNNPQYMYPMNFKAPDSVDWREHGLVTHVKNQGRCGSCWSFSATGALEGQHKRKTGKLVSLSEQNLVDCSEPFGNNGCNGGLMDNAFRYIKANDGIDTEQTYPYEAKDDRCRFIRADVGADDVGYVDVVPHEDEKALKNATASVGPISVAIDAGHSSFQFYHQGVYSEPDCSSTALDHGVLVVGYGTDDVTGRDYWIVKNSWGPSWGDEGYIKMARNENNLCGIATQASYPLV